MVDSPPPRRPTGVRTASTITTSRMAPGYFAAPEAAGAPPARRTCAGRGRAAGWRPAARSRPSGGRGLLVGGGPTGGRGSLGPQSGPGLSQAAPTDFPGALVELPYGVVSLEQSQLRGHGDIMTTRCDIEAGWGGRGARTVRNPAVDARSGERGHDSALRWGCGWV